MSALVYVASSWRNPWQLGVVKILRAVGLEVYDFRNPGPGEHGFSWSEIDENWRAWTPEEYRKALGHPIAERGFGLDMRALRAADACVLVQPCGTSAHLELGYAVGASKKTAVLFPFRVPLPDRRDAWTMFGHTLSREGCNACGSSCAVPKRLDSIEPELMAKAADRILLGRDELVDWAASLKAGGGS